MKRLMLPVLLLAALAAAVTAGIFFSRGAEEEPEIRKTGKLSSAATALEIRALAALDTWKKNETAFAASKEFRFLADLHREFPALASEARAIEPSTPEEKAALPHFIDAMDASGRVAGVFVMHQVNSAMAKPESWAKAKEDAGLANREWEAWLRGTEMLERTKPPPAPQAPEGR